METLLTARGICKYFPGVIALDDVDFDLRPGEVHILVGENGAGKSTLAKCILGAYIPESGEIRLQGEKVEFAGAKDALDKGIVAVYQEFTLVPWLSVAQNIFLNREYRTRIGLIDKKRMEREAKGLLATLNCDYINVKSPVKQLSVAEQQMVEIAKALSFKPKIIIFDEPTATLSEREISSLFEQIHKLKAAGIGIVYVSHRMQEFKRIGDRITVLRDGKKIATVGIGDKTGEELVNLMVGRDISQVYHRSDSQRLGLALETRKLSDHAGRVNDVSIRVQRGEIVGLAGLVGAGRTELAKLIFGIDPIASGELLINGQPVTGKHTAQTMVRRGVGMVCEDRKRQGLALKDSIAWNIMAVSLRAYFPQYLIDFKKMYTICGEYRKQYRIASPDVHRPCRFLSGGNQQKVVLAKWLSNNPEIIIFDEPTRGIDVGAKMEIYALMDSLADQGKAILMISSELPEVIGMSDRIYVMHNGSITHEVHRGSDDWNQEDIGAMMLGVRRVRCMDTDVTLVEELNGSPPAKPDRFVQWVKGLPPGLYMLIGLAVIFSLWVEGFLSTANFRNVLVQSVPLMILAFAQTLVVLTQGTDLSLGAMVSLVTVLWVWLAGSGVNILLSAVLAVLAVVGIGLVNGLLVGRGKLPPFIATFGTQNIAMSIALLMTAGSSIYFYHPVFEEVMETRILQVPAPVVVAAAMFVLTWVLLYRTKFGTNIFALGGNQEALALAGVSITRSYLKTYAYAGFLAGICGLITTCRVESGQPVVGMGWEFESIAATLLGGTSLREGRGGVNGTIIGVLLLTVLRNGLNLYGISAMYQNAVIGAIVMTAIVIDALVRRYRDT